MITNYTTSPLEESHKVTQTIELSPNFLEPETYKELDVMRAREKLLETYQELDAMRAKEKPLKTYQELDAMRGEYFFPTSRLLTEYFFSHCILDFFSGVR